MATNSAALDEILVDAMQVIRSRGADAIIVIHRDGKCLLGMAGDIDRELCDGARDAMDGALEKVRALRENRPLAC